MNQYWWQTIFPAYSRARVVAIYRFHHSQKWPVVGIPFHKPVVVGRERERQTLRTLLERVSEGSGTLVLLSGEAGIGKTTLVDDLIDRARGDGVLVLTGGCYDLTTTPPYGPWAEAIRGYRPDAGMPEIPSWFGNLDELEKLGSQSAIFEEAREFFASIAKHQPLLIVLEDLHWADPASIDALRYLARTLRDTPVLILATYRDDEPHPNEPLLTALPSLVREARAERLGLRRWPEFVTRDVIAGRYRLVAEDEERLASHTHRIAEGNPFYTVELLRVLETDQTLRPRAGGWTLDELAATQVPPLVRQVIERRLRTLDPDTRSLLEVAAVIGHEVPFDLWLDACGVEEAELVIALRESLEAQVISDLSDRTGVRFRHALIRESLYAGINGLRLSEQHLQIAELLIHRSASPDVIAHHFLVARDDRAIEWLVRAGLRAQQASAWISAADRFSQAEELLAQKGFDPRARAWLSYYVSTLQRFVNSPDIQLYLDRAELLAHEARDEVLLAYIMARRGDQNALRGNVRQGIAMLEESVTLFESLEGTYYLPSDAQTRSVLSELFFDPASRDAIPTQSLKGRPPSSRKVFPSHGVMSNWLGMSGDYRRGLAVGEDAERRMVECFGNEFHLRLNGVFICYFGLGYSNAGLGRPHQAQAAFESARSGTEAFRDHVMASYSAVLELIWVTIPYFADNLARRSSLLGYSVDTWTRATEMASIAGGVILSEIFLDVLEGRWKQARKSLDEEIGRLGQLSTVGVFGLLYGFLARQTGDPERAWHQIHEQFPAGHLTEPGDSFFPQSIGLLGLAVELALDNGDLETSQMWLEAHDRWLEWSGAVLGQAEGHLLWARYHLVDGEKRQVRERAEKSLACASDPRQPLALIAAHRFLGELDTREEYYEAAGEHLGAAAKLAEACQAPYEIALTQLAKAELALTKRDISQAVTLLDRAQETFEQLGAKPALKRTGRVATKLAMEAQAHPAGLTPREVEVLCLVADGLSNREIAERLYLSVRTVERHITNIYGKIEVTNRVDAAAFARQHALRPPPAR